MVQQFLPVSLLLATALGGVTVGAQHNVETAHDVSPCRSKVASMYGQPEFLTFSLSSGRSVPFDAGKYVTCSSHNYTRYFLVSMVWHLPNAAQPVPLQLGFCVPDVCDHVGIVDLVNSSTVQLFVPMLFASQSNQSLVSNITAMSPQLDLKTVDSGCIVVCVVVGFLVILVFVSTAIVIATQNTQGSELPRPHAAAQNEQLLQVEEGLQLQERRRARGCLLRLASTTTVKAFSLFGTSGTLTKLFEKSPYKPTDCLNGARVISMAWIILGHTFIMPNGVSGYANQEDVSVNPVNPDVAENNFLMQLIIGAQTAVDTFFFLSGFLLAHLTLKEIRQGKLNVLFAVILRYVRLTPSLVLVMMVFYKIWAFLGYGPFAVRLQDSINSRCNGSWWSELTYTMNFTPFDSDKVCMGWSWYLGDDMIFFIITIMILPVYHRIRMAGWLIVVALICLSFGITAYYVVSYHLSVYAFDYHYQDYSYWAYSKPYTRAPAYFVGCMAAWLLDGLERRGITRETRSKTRCAKMLAALAVCVSIVALLLIILIPATDFGHQKNSWNDIVSALFVSLARPAFAAAWAVITLLCYYDYVPLVNALLSHPCWTPLARLTYGAYLVHPLVIKLAAGRSVQFYSFNGMDMLYRFVGNALLATLGSVALWVLCERPCMTIFSPSRKSPRQRPQLAQETEDKRVSAVTSGSNVTGDLSTTASSCGLVSPGSSSTCLPPRSLSPA